jgi:hypothetical protein
MGVTCDAYHILQANLLKSDFSQLSNSQDESQVVSNPAPFLEERMFVQVE